MRVTYLGQACLLVEAAGRKLLTDPWLTEGAYFGTWYHTHLLADAGIHPEALPRDIDYIFLSHEHQDHFDPDSLKSFARDIPILISKFVNTRFRDAVKNLGFNNVVEYPSGEQVDLGDGFKVTIIGTAEYTNDAAILIEAEGCRVLNETDCKLGYRDLQRIGELGIDVGFYMFSGANWYPIMYDYPDEILRQKVKVRRSSLLQSLVQRVKLTKPRFAVPSAGPCTVLDRKRLWLNSDDRGIFIDPKDAIKALSASHLPTQPLFMAASDVWDSTAGYECRAPAVFNLPREEYVARSSERLTEEIRAAQLQEPVACEDLPKRLVAYFNETVGAQSAAVRRRIGARLGIRVRGEKAGSWTIDFSSDGPDYVREGLAGNCTYKIEVEDKLLSSFLTGSMPFFEHMLLSFRVKLSRSPDEYNEPLYHFLYDPDPERLHSWYALH